jgi:Glycosyl transferases group 1
LTGAVERALARLRGEYRRGLVVLCDVGFSGAAARSTADPAWTTVIVPRTSALLVQPELAERVAWERESLRRAAEMGVRIAAISGYMRSHLTEQIGVPTSAVVDLCNGISGVDAELTAAGIADLPPAARGGFWLAMGRAVPEKGFDDLVDALCLLRDRGVRAPHVVLAAVDDGVGLSPYQRRLAGRVTREQLDVSLLTRFSPEVRGLLAQRSIMGVIVPSRVEPFGRIPLEAYAAGAAPVVATRAGGLAELVGDGRSGYLAEPGNPADLAQALRRVAMADADTRARMRGHGREILRGFDYRESVRFLLRQIAPWLTPTGGPSIRVGAAAGGPAAGRGVAVVQVPEVCSWNPYVAAAEAALAAQGVRVVRPGLCCDVQVPAARPFRPPVEVDAATIVHLHWPEKLAHQLGVDTATAVLRDLVDRGAKIVQTVHNVRPHETTPELAAFLRSVDELTAGAHFFSADHEAEARSARPGLPHRVLHLPHPRFALPTPPTAAVMAGSVGLLGRLRGYKRTVGFARAYLQALGAHARMVVAGHVDEPEIHRGLAELAAEYPGLDYQPGFVPEERFWRLLGEVEWVALPYRRLYSSGILVAALQLGRRIISPVPTGGTGLYGTGLDQGQWRTVQPWDHTRAVEELLAAQAHLPPVGELALPSWPEVAEAMAGFYARLVEDTTTPAARSTSTGIAAPTGRAPVPVHARFTDGEVFDFGTHANDFLVRREESLATETFLVPGADRVGTSAVAHAVAVQPSFRTTGRAPWAAHVEPLAVFRSAETAFRVDESGRRMWSRDFTALDTTLRRDPNTYRVRRLGPFEYVKSVTARPRILTTKLADRLFAAASGHLPVLVEGSQSPISVKAPCEESDLDILVTVESGDDLTLARKVLDSLAGQMDHVPVPLSLGVVHACWLDLPNFYSALSLDPGAPDRRWWTAADPDRLGEATRRIRRGLDLLQNPDTVRGLLARSLEVAGRGTEQIGEWRLIPRWSGYV